jgi:hypothetical protein
MINQTTVLSSTNFQSGKQKIIDQPESKRLLRAEEPDPYVLVI